MNSQKVDPEHTGTGTGILFLNQKFTHKKLNQKQPVFLTNKRDLNDVLSSGLTKKYTGSFVLNMISKCFFTCTYSFLGAFFHGYRTGFSWIRIRIFRIGSGFVGRSGSGLRKKSPIRIRTKGPGAETLHIKAVKSQNYKSLS